MHYDEVFLLVVLPQASCEKWRASKGRKIWPEIHKRYDPPLNCFLFVGRYVSPNQFFSVCFTRSSSHVGFDWLTSVLDHQKYHDGNSLVVFWDEMKYAFPKNDYRMQFDPVKIFLWLGGFNPHPQLSECL